MKSFIILFNVFLFHFSAIAQNTDSCTALKPVLRSDKEETINGEWQFRVCSSTGYTFSFWTTNITEPGITKYVIKWGDGTANAESSTAWTSTNKISHSYSVGEKRLTFLIYRGACVDSTQYTVNVGNIPAGGITGVGGSTICAGNAQKFVIAGTKNNSQGTIYEIFYNDGSAKQTYIHPAPDTISHNFTKSSCGTTSGTGAETYLNSYGAYLTISNPCGKASGSIVPIYVSDKPVADFVSSEYSCENQTIQVKNKGNYGNNVENGVCVKGKMVWMIRGLTTGASWNIISGSLGKMDGTINPNNWVSGTDEFSVRFLSKGTYTITQYMANNSLCGQDSLVKTIFVNPIPVATINLDKSIGCAPLIVQAVGGSSNTPHVGENSYTWNVSYTTTTGCAPETSSYAYTNNTNSTAQAPQFLFNNPGIYTIQLRVTAPGGACVSEPISQTVTVKGKPNVSLQDIPSEICEGVTIQPTALVKCYTEGNTYAWNFIGGNPISSSLSIPGSINYTSPGNFTINLTVTNECGETNVSTPISVKPRPQVNMPSDIVVCNGDNVESILFTSSIDNSIITWNSSNSSIGIAASGTGFIPSFKAINRGSVPMESVITVYATKDGCIGPSRSMKITVNPSPLIAINNASICYGSSVILTASGADRFSWSPSVGLNTTTGSTVIAAPTSSMDYIVEGTFTNTGCRSSAKVKVEVKPVPSITGSYTDPTQCGSIDGSIKIDGLTANANYIVQYFKDSVLHTVQKLTSSTGSIYISDLSSGMYSDIQVVLNGCSSNKIGPYTLKNPVQPIIIIEDQNVTICHGTEFTIKPSNVPAITTYKWDTPVSDPAGVIVGGSAQSVPQVSIRQKLYNTSKFPARLTYQVTPLSGGCTNSSFQITVTVNPAPQINDQQLEICTGNTFTVDPKQSTSGAIIPDGTTYMWQTPVSTPIGVVSGGVASASPQTMISQTLLNTTNQVGVLTYSIVPVSGATGSCVGEPFNIAVTVYPNVKAMITSTRTVDCYPFLIDKKNLENKTSTSSKDSYKWYVNNVMVGNDFDFPGYTITKPFDSVVVKLVVTSSAGCNTDSVERSFYTRRKPDAAFHLSMYEGCGPIDVRPENRSTFDSSFMYAWDFGNGITSNKYQPGMVRFNIHPNYTDTIYRVRLAVFNECERFEDVRNVRVTSKPLSRFTPSKTVGCSPMSVFFNNSSLGNVRSYLWDFGDGTRRTMMSKDSVHHTFYTSTRDTILVKLIAINDCGADTSSFNLILSPNTIKLDVAVNGLEQNGCGPHTVRFINNTKGAANFLWDFGDGNIRSTIRNIDTVSHTYLNPGTYQVKLFASNNCSDTATVETIKVFSKPVADFIPSSFTSCLGDSFQFENRSKKADSYNWSFGDGNTSNQVNPSYAYKRLGSYFVTLTAFKTYAEGLVCKDTIQKIVRTYLPSGTVKLDTGYVCGTKPVRFEAIPRDADSITWDFDDGNRSTSVDRVIYHSYKHPGIYYPKVIFKAAGGCSYADTTTYVVRVDKIVSGFSHTNLEECGKTMVKFTDTSSVFFGRASVSWRFGDGGFGTGFTAQHVYDHSNNYFVEQIISGISGCRDTIKTPISVFVRSIPDAELKINDPVCTGKPVHFNAYIQSSDSITAQSWIVSNGIRSNASSFSATFANTGTYAVRFIAATKFGCYDTVNTSFVVHPTPVVAAVPDVLICKGSSVQLHATGADAYTWYPVDGLDCIQCASPKAKPNTTTPYTVKGVTTVGCFAYDTVLIKVIQPFKMNVSPGDSICIAETHLLLASGAHSYKWTPSSSLNRDDISNPIATPSSTTIYRVVGTDEYNCFTDTGYITIGVGKFPIIDLGPDTTLATGTQFPLLPHVLNGPIQTWRWNPVSDLSCVSCPTPIANIRKDITYIVTGINNYGCLGRDTIHIKAFCNNAQVYIPNAFSPDGDGINDVFMVRATGIMQVKSVRVFSRWGDVVFERTNIAPNDLSAGWDGRVHGVIKGPDVFAYTVEVICENGTPYFFKGNLTLLK